MDEQFVLEEVEGDYFDWAKAHPPILGLRPCLDRLLERKSRAPPPPTNKPPPPTTSSSRASVMMAPVEDAVRSVVSSKRLRAQFLVELVMRFSALKGLKDLDHSIHPQDLVFGKKLGGGAFGNVYQAKLRGMAVAVKQLKGLQTNEAILNLKIEVEILARLRHPHIVLYIGMSQTTTFSAMITEWCELGSLYDLIHDAQFDLPAKKLLKFALEVAEGMWYLHSMEKLLIIHRDIKSANILITGNYRAKIADFGLAVMKERDLALQDQGEPQLDYHGYCGTPQFMAPEVLRKYELYGQMCDVYSYGVMLTELATRRMPWLDRYKHLDFIPGVLERGERPTLPDYMLPSSSNKVRANELGDIILRCLSEDPASRPKFCDIIAQLECVYQLVDEEDGEEGDGGLYHFTHFEIPRFLCALQPGGTSYVQDLTRVSRELLAVLEQLSTNSSKQGGEVSEKTQVVQIVADEFMQLILQRVGSGKAMRIVEHENNVEESGGMIEVVDVPLPVLENLVCCLRLLSECVDRRLPQLLPMDQLHSLAALFFTLKDDDSKAIRACGQLLHQLCHCSADFRQMFEDDFLAVRPVGDGGEAGGEAATRRLKRCWRYQVLLLPRNQAELDISSLEREVEHMEQALFAKKKRLMELKFNTKMVLLKRRLSAVAGEDPLSLMPAGSIAAAASLLVTPPMGVKKMLSAAEAGMVRVSEDDTDDEEEEEEEEEGGVQPM